MFFFNMSRYLFGVDGMMKPRAMYYFALIRLITCGHNQKFAETFPEPGMGILLALLIIACTFLVGTKKILTSFLKMCTC